jgi:hypothetical protein
VEDRTQDIAVVEVVHVGRNSRWWQVHAVTDGHLVQVFQELPRHDFHYGGAVQLELLGELVGQRA